LIIKSFVVATANLNQYACLNDLLRSTAGHSSDTNSVPKFLYEYHLSPSQSEQYSLLKCKLRQEYQETVTTNLQMRITGILLVLHSFRILMAVKSTMISGKTAWALSQD
jgi:hypothetical protein